MKACVDCGFLALKYSMTPGLDEASASYRETGITSGVHAPFPVCFVRAYELAKEIEPAGKLSSEEVLRVIRKDRSECPEWLRWKQGHSPKEHLWMVVERDERKRETRRWWLGAIGIGILLILATLAGPSLAVWVENCFF